MTTELPITGDPAIDNLPVEKRHRVCLAIAEAEFLDNQFLAENPQCHTFIRPAAPDEIPTINEGEVWLVAVRRDQPGTPLYAHIRLRTNLPPAEVLKVEGLRSVLEAKYGRAGDGLPIRRAYIMNEASVVIC
jgi:hypothetical protein